MKYPIKNRFPSHDLIHIDFKVFDLFYKKNLFYLWNWWALSLRHHSNYCKVSLIKSSGNSKIHRSLVSWAYDDHLRFKKSAAHKVLGECDLSGISIDGYKRHGRFSQIMVDNNHCNTEIKSQNGYMTTHSFAIVVAKTKKCLLSSQHQYVCEKTSIQRNKDYKRPIGKIRVTEKSPMLMF